MSLADDKLIFEKYMTLYETGTPPPAPAPVAAKVAAYPPGTTFTYNAQNYTIAPSHTPNNAATEMQVNDATNKLVVLDATALSIIDGDPTSANIQAPKKEAGAAGAGGDPAISGDPDDPGQAGWSQAVQAGMEGGQLSSNKDSVLHGVQVPGPQIGAKDWLTKGLIKGASNVVGKMGKKAPARADAAIGY